jgi:hypothetical protein
MKTIGLLLAFFNFMLLLLSCTISPNIEVRQDQKHYVKLDTLSPYSVSLLSYYKIEPIYGSEFTEYHFYPIDTIHNLGLAQISFGKLNHRNIAFNWHEIPITESEKSDSILKSKINWTIHEYDASISAQTVLKISSINEIYILAHSDTKSNLDSILSMLKSLKIEK